MSEYLSILLLPVKLDSNWPPTHTPVCTIGGFFVFLVVWGYTGGTVVGAGARVD